MAMTKQAISYKRTPSEALCALLAPGGFLSPICDLHRNNVDVHDGLGLDVHFRSNDRIHVYRGLTRLMDLKFYRRGDLKIEAHKTHMRCDPDGAFLREWQTDEPEFKRRMDNYLEKVKREIGSRHTNQEGRVQMKWSRVTETWIPFDREARLKYCSKVYKEKRGLKCLKE